MMRENRRCAACSIVVVLQASLHACPGEALCAVRRFGVEHRPGPGPDPVQALRERKIKQPCLKGLPSRVAIRFELSARNPGSVMLKVETKPIVHPGAWRARGAIE